MNLLLEAIIVGVGTAIIGFIISTSMMFTNKNFTLKKYHFWWQIFLSFFLTGFLFHLICQVIGANRWYCKNGNACK